MRLGIAVVYLLDERQEPLLDLHLNRIERHTTVPYTIHGSANRLPVGLRQRLEEDPKVRLHEIATTALRGAQEHSHYLEKLVQAAVEDGASHIVTLHVDSFPIRDGWAEALAARLSPSCAFVTTQPMTTACLLFHRDFYLAHRPAFLLSRQEHQNPEYRQYLKICSPYFQSGSGYGLSAWSNGLGWHEMRESCRRLHPNSAVVYEDVLFHLGGAVRLAGASPLPIQTTGAKVGRAPRPPIEVFVAGLAAIFPVRTRFLFRRWLSESMLSRIDEFRLKWLSEEKVRESNRLVADPDAFIERLRGET